MLKIVILGYPPYSGHSSNIGEWISKEIKAYFQVDGKPLGISGLSQSCSGKISITVISGGDRNLMGGPHVPVPRLT